MGASESKPPPPDIDLLPPKFERRTSPLERLPLSPMEYMFGVEKRDRLFGTYFAKPDAIQVAGSFRPDYEERAVVGVSAAAGRNAKGAAAATSLMNDAFATLGYTNPDPLAMFAARLGTDGSARALAAGLDTERGVGGYASVPLDYFLDAEEAKRYGPDSVPAAAFAARARAAGVGYGIAGAPVRYTHFKPSNETALNAASAAAAQVVSPSAVSTSGGDVSATSAAPSGAMGSRAAALPEVGLRYFGGDRFSAGLHAAPVAPYPLKAWAVGALSGEVTAGVEISTDALRLLPNGAAALSSAAAQGSSAESPRAAVAGSLPTLSIGGSGGGVGAGAAAAGRDKIDVSAAVSVSQAPLYELSVAFDGVRREIVAGFVYNQVIRRAVRNPFEDNRVKGIFNYVDVGFELRRPLMPPAAVAAAVSSGAAPAALAAASAAAPASLAVAASWQLNRNWLVKGRLGSRDASASVVGKVWADTAATVCATATLDRETAQPRAGFFLTLERGGALEYQKALEGYQTAATHMALASAAAGHASQRVSASVDMETFAKPPTAGVSPAGAALAVSGRQPASATEYSAVSKATTPSSKFL